MLIFGPIEILSSKDIVMIYVPKGLLPKIWRGTPKFVFLIHLAVPKSRKIKKKAPNFSTDCGKRTFLLKGC